MPLEVNSVNNAFTLSTKENRSLGEIEAFPAIATLYDRFLISYLGLRTGGGLFECQVTTLDYVRDNNNNGTFGVSERKVVIGDVGTTAPRSGGAASRFSGGLYGSRYVGIAHRQNNATVDVRAARFEANAPHTPGTQYCVGNTNSTGDRGFITIHGNQGTQIQKYLRASSLPTFQFCYFLVGHNGFSQVAVSGSNGLLCISGGILGRYNRSGEIGNTGSGGMHSLQITPSAIRSNAGNVVATVGSTFNFQAWHRESGGSSNFTNAVSLTFRN